MLTCGIDEVGRGPLAGPVTAAAVILPEGFPTHLLRDSKALSARKRAELSALIRSSALCWGIGWANHLEIDSLNILRATHLAMQRALGAMETALDDRPRTHGPDVRPYQTIVDGSILPELAVPATALIAADRLVPAVMAASIIAKEARDSWMTAYSSVEPRYGFECHMGYPTPFHKEQLTRYGPCPIHRRSFAPVRDASSPCSSQRTP